MITRSRFNTDNNNVRSLQTTVKRSRLSIIFSTWFGMSNLLALVRSAAPFWRRMPIIVITSVGRTRIRSSEPVAAKVVDRANYAVADLLLAGLASLLMMALIVYICGAARLRTFSKRIGPESTFSKLEQVLAKLEQWLQALIEDVDPGQQSLRMVHLTQCATRRSPIPRCPKIGTSVQLHSPSTTRT